MKVVSHVSIAGAAAVATALLCGCPTVHEQYLPKPEEVSASGNYVHPQSKLVFPEKIGAFKRDMIFRYDAAGRDVSAGYNLLDASNHIAATIYVYPGPSLTSIGGTPNAVAGAKAYGTQNEFQRREQEIEYAHPGAVLVGQRDIVHAEGGQSFPGRMATFEYEDVFAGSRMPLRSYLCVFCYISGHWAIEIRITHPQVENADDALREFLHNLNWTGPSNEN